MSEKANKLENIDLNEILAKMKSRTQFEDFFQKAGNPKNLKIGFYFPDFSHSNSDFAFQVLKGEKKVSIHMTFIYTQ